MGALRNSLLALLLLVPAAVGAPSLSAEETVLEVELPRPDQPLYPKDYAPELATSHDRVRAALARLESARHSVRSAEGGWYPKLDVHADAGGEYVEKSALRIDSDSSNEWRNVESFRATQLLTDFGRTEGLVGRAREAAAHSEKSLDSARQDVLREGVLAFLNVVRARDRLYYARQSEQSIKGLTQMQESLLQRGAGLQSEALQSSSQLAGAAALRNAAEGELINSRYRFETVFAFAPADDQMARFAKPDDPADKLPASLETALEIARAENPRLLAAKQAVAVAEQELRVARSALYPRLNLAAEAARRENVDGVSGVRNEARGLVEFNMNLYSGGSDTAQIRAAQANVEAARRDQADLVRQVEQQVRVSWQTLLTQRENAKTLRVQAQITRDFLELARKEHKLGTRSLLDVLTGEVNFINATSNYVSAQIDALQAAYDALYAMGRLEAGVI